MDPPLAPLVTTIKERCRLCYTCVRECPAKAIRIAGGQADVQPERCIGCGNCVRVCSQKAKQVRSGIEDVERLLRSSTPVAAIIAPSFPAEFPDLDSATVVGMLRALGFAMVNETALGADLIAAEYGRLLAETDGKRFVATTCPAIVAYVERYHPGLVPSLAPIVSPMVATARALRQIHDPTLKVVFIGPCIAKKGEAGSRKVEHEIDAVLTFIEFREICHRRAVTPESVSPSDFDPPHGGAGLLLPISRGMLQAAGLHEDLLAGDFVAADGRSEFIEAIREFEGGDLNARLLDVLCCNGCIMGPGISSKAPLFNRRSQVSRYAKQRMADPKLKHPDGYASVLAGLNLRRGFSPYDQRLTIPPEDHLAEIMVRLGKLKPEDELNCGACGYETCREHASAIHKGLAEVEMCLPYTIEQLRHACKDLATSNEQLASAQGALVQSAKLASMGQLAAGIAHEINNPLTGVLTFAHLLRQRPNMEDQDRQDIGLIISETTRVSEIVRSLLDFARERPVAKKPVNVNDVVIRTMRLLRNQKAFAKITIEKHLKEELPHVAGDTNQIQQVLLNLSLNACEAMPNGGRLTISTLDDGGHVLIRVADTGLGIGRENLNKIFEPFFSTKPIGTGTGLGLSVSYGIIQQHGGTLTVETKEGEGTTFTIVLPTLPGE
ncbi:MAG TPA: [Fe-Fe] hydrogenase large subunit C-terminal domain-containing protein [Phycisphaerae bacterium]|nr:[Fe-Fe] hydrogenase large subunit C-terminal domain-containing protein [Phycisphaerae bacterium]